MVDHIQLLDKKYKNHYHLQKNDSIQVHILKYDYYFHLYKLD